MSPRHHFETPQALQLDIYVDPASWEGQFDSLEVWRSNMTDGGPYVQLTGPAWAPASIPGPASRPATPVVGPGVTLLGLTLTIQVGKVTIAITFAGPNPVTLENAANQIQAASNGLLSSFVVGTQLYVQTTQSGTGASFTIVSGTGAPILGLPFRPPENTAMGVDARIPLVLGTTNYCYTDLSGSPNYFYKTRFYNTLTEAASDFSIPFRGEFLSGVTFPNLVRATVDLVDGRGVARANVPVLLFNRFNGTQVQGKTMIGGQTNGMTDKNGHFETLLVRGTQTTVAIGGTNLVRDIDVPTSSSVQSFDLLDPTYGSNDLFNVQVPQLQYAVRRST